LHEVHLFTVRRVRHAKSCRTTLEERCIDMARDQRLNGAHLRAVERLELCGDGYVLRGSEEHLARRCRRSDPARVLS
jgi:hypothetical protein